MHIDNLSLQHILDEDAELIPLMTPEDEEEMKKEEVPEALPLLPLRNTVLFPGVVIPITAGRDQSIKLIKEANKGNKTIGVVAQINELTENPGLEDIYKVGTVARILNPGKSRLTTANFDMIAQYRPAMNIVSRPTHEAGKGFNFAGHHEIMIPLLAWALRRELSS